MRFITCWLCRKVICRGILGGVILMASLFFFFFSRLRFSKIFYLSFFFFFYFFKIYLVIKSVFTVLRLQRKQESMCYCRYENSAGKITGAIAELSALIGKIISGFSLFCV
jgi:hypothetical protein